MPLARRPFLKVKTLSFGQKPLYTLALMVFFWCVFDGIVSYITPLAITEKGISKTAMGLIYSASSVAGAIFDFLLSKTLRNTHFRRLFGLMFLLCLIYPLLLMKATTTAMFLVAMAFWGLYFDLQNFALFDFVSRKSPPQEHASSFGILGVFKSLGYLIAPLLAGLLVEKTTAGTKPFLTAFAFLLVSLIIFVVLLKGEKNSNKSYLSEKTYKQINFLTEFHLWKKLGVTLFPLLFLTMILYIFDAFFWTIGPLYSIDFAGFKNFGGLFMTMYTLPMILSGWLVGPATKKFGKKKTAFVSFFVSALLLIPLAYFKTPYPILGLVLVSSLVGSLAWPAIKGAFVDYITEASVYEKEIEGLTDFFTNLGYVFGPALAGFLSDKVGNGKAISYLGLFTAIVSLVLFFVTPKKIKVVVKS